MDGNVTKNSILFYANQKKITKEGKHIYTNMAFEWKKSRVNIDSSVST